MRAPRKGITMMIDLESLPEYIANLRDEAAKYRVQRNEARAEADGLRAELSALKARTDG
jgi:hypothetical protein